MPEYFDRQCNPISTEEGRRLWSDKSYQQVALDRLDNGTSISTVWLGTSYMVGPSGPMIFETIVFDANQKKELEEYESYRYATEEEAMKHHKHLVDTYYDEQEVVSRWSQVRDEF